MCAVEVAGQRIVQNIHHQRGLARPRNARDAHQFAERNIHGQVSQVVGPRAGDAQVLAVALPPAGGQRYLFAAGQVSPGQRLGVRQNLLRRAFSDDAPAVLARAGSQVHHPIGGPDRVIVVFDHQDGVAQIAQILQRFQQAAVIAGVQPDRGLVQHIQHAHQTRTDLRCQPDALGLAARKRTGRTPQGQIVQPYVHQETQARADLLDDTVNDGLLAHIER